MSKIPWCEKTWNPVIGCTKVSAGCTNCYAEKMSCRLAAMGQEKYKKVVGYKEVHPFVCISRKYWNNRVICDEKALEIPLHWKKSRMIFVNSMSDTFHPKVPEGFIIDIFDIAAKAASMGHTLQFLTKRPERMLDIIGEYCNWVRNEPNIWLGTTCENQETADKRIPTLLQIPAAVRFISAEPLLEDLDFTGFKPWWGTWEEKQRDKGIDQVIIGAESIGGHPGRECKIEWVRNIVRQCKAAGVAVFVKQIHLWKVGNKKTGEYFETLEQASKFYSKRDSFPDITKPKRVLLKYPRDKDLFPKDLQVWEYPK